MTQRISRRFVLGALLASSAEIALAGAPQTSLRPPIKPKGMAQLAANPMSQVLRDAAFSGEASILVADAETGRVLEGFNPFVKQPPASVAKAVTALYALRQLGPKHRFKTRLLATGELRNGILEGDLILAGGGDPVFATNPLTDLAKALKNKGIREVRGRFLIYGGALPFVWSIDAGQPDHLGYNPAISGMNLNFNRVHFEWKRAQGEYLVSMDARSDKYRPEVQMAHMAVKPRSAPIYTYEEGEAEEHWTVARAALGDGGSRWLPVRKPELYAADVFATMARAHGIVLPKGAVIDSLPETREIAVHNSEPLTDILRGMLKYSTNLTAETVGLSASQQMGRVETLAESGNRMSVWAKNALDMTTCEFVDHSGLGDASRIAARDMVRALVAAEDDPVFPGLLKEIKLADRNGQPIPESDIRVRAKTGTLNFVSALAGYITTKSGRKLAFAIFTADMEKRAAIAPADRERPQGGKAWARRSRKMQMELLVRWAAMFDTPA
ncbi:D-alanyl-D-alanine carboxypeptidase/D-alanyl-D-alanine-endopeptidase [Halocynthiibacter sp. SDUM655004]|uniref:D-alanyl-D-alanine carboxypeptidase/D-alanyl-D-alanine-endopeptidase n=1 Tax=Halocynthiibacter halioticoli TaxID=2986804 RepID=A0AAE3IZ40_9RHOB|nr:D-alanyl-D-alanine carboxypeptidase/D-alanyl-D-alanine-endopeptidase [Halocynthiibacter halioticoli]MCW4056569.1 D-alanyl-D-alanine carboxypeptidase/D-alanyl-D-alanine-endopeptidase [Halocynthiibacter sp. SDUM655004]